jgi:hypothetical protein
MPASRRAPWTKQIAALAARIVWTSAGVVADQDW